MAADSPPAARQGLDAAHYALAACMGLVMVAIFGAGLASARYPYGPDASAYIEAARNLAQGALPVFEGPVDDEGSVAAPQALFPPGFPLLIRAVSSLSGVGEPVAAVAIQWVSWAFLPVLAWFALRPVAGVAAHGVGLLVGLSPGVIAHGWRAQSDVLFLAIAMASFGLLLRGFEGRGRPALLAAAGLACGLGYLTRNAGVALIAATLAGFGLLAVSGGLARSALLRRFGWWSAGLAAVLGPYLMWNLKTFGALQPYQMPPSEVGVIHNARVFLQAQLMDLSASEWVASLAWHGPVLLAVTVLLVAWLWRSRRAWLQGWQSASPQVRLAVAGLACYAAAGMVMVVFARSRYQWGEPINLRHVLQYSWAILGLAAIAVARGGRSRAAAMTALALVVVLVAARLSYAHEQLAAERRVQQAIAAQPDPLRSVPPLAAPASIITEKLKLALARDAALIARLRAEPASTVLVSNFADVFIVTTDRPVRRLEFSACRLEQALTDLPCRLGTTAPLRVLVSPNQGMVRSGCWAQLKSVPITGYVTRVLQPNLIELTPLAR